MQFEFQKTYECSLKRICKSDFFCRSHLLNMIRFQLDMHKNLIWTDGLNKAQVAALSL